MELPPTWMGEAKGIAMMTTTGIQSGMRMINGVVVLGEMLAEGLP